MFDYLQNCFKQIFGNIIRLNIFLCQLPSGLYNIAGPDQDRLPATGIAGTFNVLGTVTDHDGIPDIDIVSIPGLKDETRFGLSARTPLVRGVRTEKNVADMTAPGFAGVLHATVDMVEVRRADHLTVDRRLIGDKDDGKPVLGQTGYGLPAVWKKFKLCPALDIIGGIPVDDTVPVQKNKFLIRCSQAVPFYLLPSTFSLLPSTFYRI
jgi:hypothetical protein